MNDELSDFERNKLYNDFCKTEKPTIGAAFDAAWRECRSRAEALIEEEHKHKAKLYDLLKEAQGELRHAFASGWEAVSAYAGDQGWRDPLVDPDMALDRAFREYLYKGKE